MQKVNPERVEMIRRREKDGFCFIDKSFLAERVEKVPDIGGLEKLASGKWWDSPGTMAGFVNGHNGEPANVGTQLRIVYDSENIFAALYMEEPEMGKTRTLITKQGTRETSFSNPPEIEKRIITYPLAKDDNVGLMLDLTGGRKRYVNFVANMAGVHYADEAEFNYAEPVYPVCNYLEPWPGKYETKVTKGPDHWCAAFKIPWASAGLKPEDVKLMGVNAARTRTVREWHTHLLAFAPAEISAFDFAHLYFNKKSVEVGEADFGRPVLDWNTVSLKIKNTSGGPLKLDFISELTVDSTQEIFSCERAKLKLARGKAKSVALKYRLDMHEPLTQTLRISIFNEDAGSEIFTTFYRLGILNADVPADYRWDFPGPQPDPAPDDEGFLEKKMNYFQSRIPKFDRVTTNDGAPSDFTLRSLCGKYEFNLMKPGVLREIADMIAKIFDDPTDRLCAAVLLAHGDAFSRHMAPHVALHSHISSLSALRLNAGHCYSRALVWLGIARELKAGKGNERYGDRAHALLIMGHVIGAIEAEDGEDRYIFDPTFGTYYYRWDNRTLATQRELCEDYELADRVIRNRLKDFVNPQCHTPIPAGSVVFPQLAPAE